MATGLTRSASAASSGTPNARTMPAEKYDAVIIGSGLGGLTCAAHLSRNGKKRVLVLEQYKTPGGCASTFKIGDDTIEVALHEMDWGHNNIDMKPFIFKHLGILDKIKAALVPVPEAWEVRSSKESFVVPHGFKNVREYLCTKFPHEKKGIKKYFRYIDVMAHSFYRFPEDMNYFRFFLMPITYGFPALYYTLHEPMVGKYLDSIIKDPKLKMILNANVVYYHDNPYQLSMNWHGIPQRCYYESAQHFKGGSAGLTKILIDTIKERGGEIRCNSDVQKITTQEYTGCMCGQARGRVRGVTYLDTQTNSRRIVEAPVVVANCAPELVYASMVPPIYFDEACKRMDRGISLIVLYMITDIDLKKAYPNRPYSTFIMRDSILSGTFGEFASSNVDSSIYERDFVFVDHSRIPTELTAPGRTYCSITAAGYLHEWDKLTPEQYKAQKDAVVEAYLAKLEAHYPGIRAHIVMKTLSTPKTIVDITRSPGGALYGWQQRSLFPTRRTRHRSRKLKGLYFANAWTFPGGGFTGTILGGWRTGRKITDPNALAWRIVFTLFMAGVTAALTFVASQFLFHGGFKH